MKKIDKSIMSKLNSLEEDNKEDYAKKIQNESSEEEQEEDIKEEKKSVSKTLSKKKKKVSNFCICTAKCRSEKELIQHVIAKNGWKVILNRKLLNIWMVI